MYAASDESSLYSRINYVLAPTGIMERPDEQRWHSLVRTRIALCQRPGADTEETGRYDLAWKDFV